MQKNLNDILPPSRRRSMMDEMGSTQQAAVTPPTYTPPSRPMTASDFGPTPPPPLKRKFPIGTALIALGIIVLSVVALFVFSKATVQVVPQVNPETVSGNFTATASGGDLPYELVTVEKIGTQNVPAESTETVNQPAQGTITITNSQAVPQALVKDTRFQSATGLIYRIHASITVPAAKNGVPGSVTATAYADKSGDTYNIPATTFTVPGLKGGKAYDLVTAKSTDAMAGGFSGTRGTVAQATRDAQYAAIQTALAADMQTALKAKVPAGYLLVPGASFTTYQSQPDQAGTSGAVQLSEKGSVTAVIFPDAALAKAVAYQVVGTYAGQTVSLADVSKLTLKPATASLPSTGQDFAFTLTGDTTVLWKVDAAKIAGAVAGKTRDSAQVALSGFSEINKATLILRPFWASTFPADPARITVTVSAPTSK